MSVLRVFLNFEHFWKARIKVNAYISATNIINPTLYHTLLRLQFNPFMLHNIFQKVKVNKTSRFMPPIFN